MDPISWVMQEMEREKALRAALGHYAEENQAPTQDMSQVDESFRLNYELQHGGSDPNEPQYAARHIAAHKALLTERKLAPNDETLDMSTPESRLKALNRLTQNDPDSENKAQDHDCVASSLLAAAMVGDGNDGLIALMNGMDKFSKEDAEKLEAEGGDLYQLRQKIANGEKLTMGDMHSLQKDLYKDLNGWDEKMGIGGHGASFISQQVFLNDAYDLDLMMQAHKLKISNLDATGQGSINHAVLQIGDNAIYDPTARHGGQIVTNEDDVSDYHKADKIAIQ